MCGISGIFAFHEQVDIVKLEKMGKTLTHRGPDHFASIIIGNIGLAHNRLSIVDLSSTGDQPFFDDDHYLIYNGEIYNHDALRPGLKSRGVSFRGTSDTETLFECLKTYGVEETLQMIKGMFAFAYYDQTRQSLFLCRDRYGIKPLFWTCDSNGLYWASEVKSLMIVPGVKVDPVRTLFSINGSSDQSNKYTLFENVFHVPPGHYLVCDATHQPRLQEYYSILKDVDQGYFQELSEMPDEHVLTKFEGLLSDSVRKMLMSDVPVGIFVSGGIDSSLVAVLAHQYKKDINLFTSEVVGKYSELPYSRLLSETLGLQLHINQFQPDQFVTDLTAATYAYEAPMVKFANALAFGRVAELTKKAGIKPVLTGEGSDELFLGYPMLHFQKYKGIIDFPKNFVDRLYSLIPLLKSYVIKSQNENVNDFLPKLAAGFERQYLREYSGLDAYQFLGNIKRQKEYYQSIQMMREHLIALLHRNDRMGMQYSIESRFPFLDEEVVRFAVNLPMKWKFRTVPKIFDKKHPFLMDKAIVRLIAQRLLPGKLVNKPKWGFGIYGHQNLRVSPSFFNQGYISNLLKLDNSIIEYMVETQDRYMIAKLVCLEVFGRLFDWQQSQEVVNEGVFLNLKMEI